MLTPLLLTAVLTPAADDHPVTLDRTGIEWAIPFASALDRARAQERLLLIKPVAFGTTKSGCW